jgi:hypothetical protein
MRPVVLSIGVVLAGSVAGCTVKDPLYCDLPDHPCIDPTRPYCDESAAFPASEGIAKTCIPSPFDAPPPVDAAPDAPYACTPNTQVCASGAFVACDGTGHIINTLACGPLGCSASGDACLDIDPTNALAAQLDLAPSGPAVALTGMASIDTDKATVTDGSGATVSVPTAEITQGANLPAIRVFRVKSLTVESLRAVGTDALAIVADGDVIISGTIDVSARLAPPLYTPASGPGGVPSTNSCTGQYGTGGGGGGGGGRWFIGGVGGKGGGAGAGGSGSTLTTPHGAPLLGGCFGGGGASPNPSMGGGGGGAIQITSRTRILLQASARANAGGGGAQNLASMGVGGGGGGSGGLILLEAPAVDVSSSTVVLAARGGGGASSSGQTTANPAGAGSDGDANPSTSQPAGGMCSVCASGGAGGQLLWTPSSSTQQVPGTGAPGSVCGGGGGGGAGLVVVKTATGTTTWGAIVRGEGELTTISTRNRTH